MVAEKKKKETDFERDVISISQVIFDGLVFHPSNGSQSKKQSKTSTWQESIIECFKIYNNIVENQV